MTAHDGADPDTALAYVRRVSRSWSDARDDFVHAIGLAHVEGRDNDADDLTALLAEADAIAARIRAVVERMDTTT